MTNILAQNKIVSVSGFNRATFAFGKTILLLENGEIKHINMALDNCEMLSLNLVGHVAAVSVSNDFSVFVLAIEENSVAKVAVYSLDFSIGEEKAVYSTQFLPAEICISQATEVVACLSVLEERIHFQTIDIKDEINNCAGNILLENPTKNWQISFCPADEGVLCALGNGIAYLLRANSGHIENFSMILLPEVICHDWANDVNIIFGNGFGFLHIYRETILLDSVNICQIAESVLKDSLDTSIISIRSTTRRFACQTKKGVILIFNSTAENGPDWSSSRAFIITDFKLKQHHSLSFDFSDDLLLYDTGNTLETVSVYTLSKLNCFKGDIVAARHCSRIIGVRATESTIITLDETGYLAIFSRFTNRVLCKTQISDVFFFTILTANLNEILVITKENARVFTIMLDGLNLKETVFCQEIVLDTQQIMFSKDKKYLLFRTKNDTVICVDVFNKKTLWSADYKLHFFQSMGCSKATILLLNQKFIVTRIKHGKDLSNVNMHASDIGFSITSEMITGNDDYVFITTERGDLLCSHSSSLDEPVVVNSKMKQIRITTFRAYNDELFVGYEDGSVGALKLSFTDKIKNVEKDYILCDFNEVTNLKSLLRQLNAEKNIIKESTENFLNLFTKTKLKEICDLKTYFEKTMKECKDKIELFENDHNASELLKKQTVSSLQKLYQDENIHQKKKYETMIEDQIKKSFRQLEEKQNEIEELQQAAEKKHRKMIESFHVTEKQLLSKVLQQLTIMKNDKKTINLLHRDLGIKQHELYSLHENHDEESQKLRKTYEENVRLLEDEILTVKSTCIRLNEQRDKIWNENIKNSTLLKNAQQEINHIKDENATQILETDNLKQLLQNIRIKEHNSSENLAKLKKKYYFQNKQWKAVLLENHHWKRRMQNLESRIEELASCVYDSRRLEHSVLKLLAMSQNVDLDKRYNSQL